MNFRLIIILFNFVVISCSMVYADTVSMDDKNYYMISSEDILYSLPYTDDMKSNQTDACKIELMRDVKSVSANYAVKKDGTLWTWNGDNLVSKKVMDSVTDCSAYNGFVLIKKNDESLWGLGNNICGQLATGELTNNDDVKYLGEKYLPASIEHPIKIMDDVKLAKACNASSIVLKTDGSVWTFGSNEGGALGYDTSVHMSATPKKIMDNVKNIFSGNLGGYAIMSNSENTLWKWGSDYSYFAGFDPSINVPPIQFVNNAKYALRLDGSTLIIKQDDSLWIYESNDLRTSSNKIANDVCFVMSCEDTSDGILVLFKNGDLKLMSLAFLGLFADLSRLLFAILTAWLQHF